MSTSFRARSSLSALALALAAGAFAQATTAPAKPATAPPPPAQGAQPAPPAPEKPKTIDEMTKDFTKLQGVLTFYRKTTDTSDILYLELPEDSFGKMLLLQITSASGMGDTGAFVFHGMPLGDVPIIAEKVDNGHIQFIQPNLDHRGETPEAKRGIERSFPVGILGTFEVKARQPERKSVLIDVTGFFKSDVADLGQAVDSPRGGYMMDPSGARIDTVKDFPENAVIRTVYRLIRKTPMEPGPKALPWAVSFNISEIPTTGYKPRIGDPRVGFFTVNYEDLSDAKNYDNNVNYILRWNLEKADPSLPLSPPKKPIVFWIDNSVPQEYRAAVRKGLTLYNEAFETIGIKDAIQVNQMPDNADWDIADLRYNTVRWTTGMPFAIALFRANPVTGEILNACINMDAGFASTGAFNFDQVVNPATFSLKQPETAFSKLAARYCDINQEGQLLQTTGRYAAELLSPPGVPFNQKEYINQYITEVVAHEMGHCLGLRHNFAASTQFTLKELGDENTVGKFGTAASVMDYNLFNVGAVGKTGVDYYSQHVGTYDKWAIQYGYTPIASASPEGEVPTLKKMASLGSEPGHQYQSDGAADDFDPYIVRFDVSKEPVDSDATLASIGRRVRNAATAKIQSGDSYFGYTQAFLAGLNAQFRGVRDAMRYIGGGRLATAFVGDPGGQMPYRPVDFAEQRRALNLIVDNVLSADALRISPTDLAKLTFNPNSPGNEVSGRSRLFPMRRSLSLTEGAALSSLFDADLLNRIQNNEFRSGGKEGTFTMAELFHTVSAAVWSEVDAKKPVTDLRRDLQRTHLGILTSIVLGQPGMPADAKSLALEQLRSLRSRIASAVPSEKDEYTKAHLNECLMRIDRALNAQMSVVGNG